MHANNNKKSSLCALTLTHFFFFLRGSIDFECLIIAMHSNSPEFFRLPRQRSLGKERTPPTRLAPLESVISPVLVSTTAFFLHDRVPLPATSPGTPSLEALHSRIQTPIPLTTKPLEWVSTRRSCTAPDNGYADLYCGEDGSRARKMAMTTTAQVRSSSMEQLTTCGAAALRRMDRLPPAVRQSGASLPTSAVTEFSLETFKDDATTRSTTTKGDSGSSSRSSSSLSATQPNWVPPSCDVSNSLNKGTAELPRSSPDVGTPLQMQRIAVLESHTRVFSDHCADTPLPPLPKTPIAMAVPSVQSSTTPSPRKSPCYSGEAPRLPGRDSPQEGYGGLRALHRPQPRLSDSDELDNDIVTLVDMDGLPEDCVNGAVGEVVPARRGKRVGRGFNRKSSRDLEAGELVAPQALVSDHGRLTRPAGDTTCNDCSTGPLGVHCSAIERGGRRTSISFNNEVFVADDDETKDDELRHLRDTPHHLSVAQLPPLSLIESSYSGLSSTTLFKRDGVTYII